jgi:hypothetical protein
VVSYLVSFVSLFLNTKNRQVSIEKYLFWGEGFEVVIIFMFYWLHVQKICEKELRVKSKSAIKLLATDDFPSGKCPKGKEKEKHCPPPPSATLRFYMSYTLILIKR